jgi:hypothetical protein
MKKIVLTTPLIKEIKEMRETMIANIIDLMKQHGVNEASCNHFQNCPVIHNGICEDDVYTLDDIDLYNYGGKEFIILSGSNECYTGIVDPNYMDIELLIEVYNWVMDYENELFEPIKE